MKILDRGHIYELTYPGTDSHYTLKFVKRSGGCIYYEKEWPGIQTQAVMRALIDYLDYLDYCEPSEERTYYLWQLGTIEAHPLMIKGLDQACDLLRVLIDRSRYLNAILPCVETEDSIHWLNTALFSILNPALAFGTASDAVRSALWCYEARAYRRKQEKVNREEPAHDDSARPRAWRDNPCDDVPFDITDIENRPIGDDGHIVLEIKELV